MQVASSLLCEDDTSFCVVTGCVQCALWERKPDAVKGRVLVVDDDLALAEMLGIVLRNEGLEVNHVADGPSAIGAFRDHRPDLVLLDVMLPGIDGLEVCRQIRA